MYAINSLSFSSYTRELFYQKATREIDRDLNEYKQLLQKFETAPRSELFNESSFRRVIYYRNLMPRSICAARFSLAFTAEFVKNNIPMVRNQLFPYLVREVSSITRKDCILIDDYMNALLNYFAKKTSRLDIVTFLSKRGIKNPHQFLNNLFHFVSTGQCLEVYDQNSEYIPRAVSYFREEQPDDEDVMIVNANMNNDVQVVGEYGDQRRQRPHPPDCSHANENNGFRNFSHTNNEEHNTERDDRPTTSRQSSSLNGIRDRLMANMSTLHSPNPNRNLQSSSNNNFHTRFGILNDPAVAKLLDRCNMLAQFRIHPPPSQPRSSTKPVLPGPYTSEDVDPRNHETDNNAMNLPGLNGNELTIPAVIDLSDHDDSVEVVKEIKKKRRKLAVEEEEKSE